MFLLLGNFLLHRVPFTVGLTWRLYCFYQKPCFHKKNCFLKVALFVVKPIGMPCTLRLILFISEKIQENRQASEWKSWIPATSINYQLSSKSWICFVGLKYRYYLFRQAQKVTKTTKGAQWQRLSVYFKSMTNWN